ncbi:MAG: zinc-binding dehydrogenase [Acidimicrobiia bacterium]|nr:zinc-binding dehydrogenase [Acidimicrobiia bacterium]
MTSDAKEQDEVTTTATGPISGQQVRAIIRDKYGSPDVLGVVNVDKPVPGEGEVLVRVIAASVNTADLDLLLGVPFAARIAYGFLRPRNRRLGLDVSGRVEAVGSGVTGLESGDEVWSDMIAEGQGAFAEYVCAPEKAFTVKPENLTFEQAATVPHSGLLALQALRKIGPIKSGQTILINGAGGCVGPFAIQLAKVYGAEVSGVDHTEKLDMMRSLGADHVLDYTAVDVTRTGERYDLILDIAANRSVRHYRRVMEHGGRYVQIARNVVGFFDALLVGGAISLIGNKSMGIFGWVPNEGNDKEYLARLLDSRQIVPLIDSRYELDEIADAFRHVQSGNARGKVIITVDHT